MLKKILFGAVLVCTNTLALSLVTIGTGSVSGTYYPTGNNICKLVNMYEKDTAIKCTIEATSGSVYNINSIKNNTLEIAIAQSDMVHQAYNGVGKFQNNGSTNLRAIMSIYPELLTFVVNKNANITKLEDIKNKKINVGEIGSGSESSVKILFANSNISTKELAKEERLNPTDMQQALIDGKIDGYFFVLGHPNNTIKELAQKMDIAILPLQGQNIDSIIAQYPYYSTSLIKANTYQGVNEDVNTYGVKAILITSTNTSEKIIYQITKAIVDNFDEFKTLHPAYANMTKETLLDSLSIPLHDGAKKYYQEKGIIKK